jgi:NADH-quinone oxidoreductase subunit L
MSPTTWAWLVLAFPLAGTIGLSLGWRWLPGRSAGWIGTAAIFASFACAVGALLSLEGRSGDEAKIVVSTAYDYANTLGVDAKLTILVDPLSVFMILVVSGVSGLIHLYSVSYLWEDRGFARFFAYLNYFVFSMLLLVLAGNFFILIIGWAFVGAASYMLISFWYRRHTATNAGIKAFVMNVIGDVGLVLGTFFIFKHTHTLDFIGTFDQTRDVFSTDQGDLVAGCILLLVGAFAKSAQVPLHTWLPDAMEGPTPVSALIHAATMVTAGVYLIARMHPLFEQAPAAADVGAIGGCATLFIAATIALTQTDLKRVIAYSTMSQIGYMIMAVSSAGYTAGLFHLMTHAFFKALLFMGAGSIIGAMAGVQSLDRMSGFRKALPFTYFCFLAGGLSLAAFPLFAGFFSKDDVLAFVAEDGGFHWILYVVGYIAAFLTAVYTFRMIFRAFLGEPCPEAKELEETGHLHHGEPENPLTGEKEDTDVGFPGPGHFIAERELPMKIAMSVLAVGSVFLGVLQLPFGLTDALDKFLEPTFADSTAKTPSDGLEGAGLAISTVLSIAGIGLAYVLWVLRPELPGRIRARAKALYELSFNKWYFDEAYDRLFLRPGAAVGRFCRDKFERWVVDGVLIGGTTGAVKAGSAVVRGVQSGYLRLYAALLLFGVVGIAFYFLIVSS